MTTPNDTPAPPAQSTVEEVVSTAVQVAGVLVPEAAPALAIFGLLEPEIQVGVAALIKRFHAKQPTAQDFLALAAQQVGE